MATNRQEILDDVLRHLKEDGIRSVRFEFLDSNAVARSKTVPARHFNSIIKSGVMFPVAVFSCDPTADLTPSSTILDKYLYSDVAFHPDLSTFSQLPWLKDTARVFLSAIDGPGNRAMFDPRNIALAQIDNLKSKGLSIFSSFEHEFWVVDQATRKPIIDGVNVYATIRLSKHQQFLDEVAENLFKAGVNVEAVETEYAKGQFEVTFCPAYGIQSADNAATFRTGIKEMAMQRGFVASFMSKPYPEEEGSSAHFNFSLWSLDGKTALTGDPSRQYGLSEIAEHWLAGLLEHAPALSVLQSPTLCCRDRFKSGGFAPFNATWGIDNRTCAIRVKRVGEHGVFLENRIGSSAGNPYISVAANIAAGVDGIDRKLSLPLPVPTNESSDNSAHVPPDTALLPTDMESAFTTLKADEVISSAIGAEFVDVLENIRRLEMKKCEDSELDRCEMLRNLYFDYI